MTLPQNTQKILVAFASLLIGISVGLYIEQLFPKNTTTDVDRRKPITEEPSQNQKTDARVTLHRLEIRKDYKKYGLPDPCDFEAIQKLKLIDPPGHIKYYENKEKGVAKLEIPHNPEWGSGRFRVEPYEVITKEDEDWGGEGIVFGEISYAGEGCGGYGATNFFKFLPAKSEAEVIKEIQDIAGPNGDNTDGLWLNTHTIYDKRIVGYSFGGMCGGGGAIVIGKKYNYEFTGLCGGFFPEYAKMISTMEFID